MSNTMISYNQCYDANEHRSLGNTVEGTWKLGRCHKLIDVISPADEFEMHFKRLTSDIVPKITVDSDQYIPVPFYYDSFALKMSER